MVCINSPHSIMRRIALLVAPHLVVIGLAAAAFALGASYWIRVRYSPHEVPSRSYPLQGGNLDEWTALGGTWEIGKDALHNNSDERGAKLLTGSHDWKDYTLRADIRFSADRGDMGLVVRSNDEMKGLDAYNGYYVGLRATENSLFIGRSSYGWFEARPVPLPGGVNSSTWYRLRVTAYGCDIAASAQNLSTNQMAWIAFRDHSCLQTGRIALRSVETGGMWRNVAVTPATQSDYLELRQHAASVESPMVFDGPPWWTPWHVGMLFAGALLLALLTQLVYFRVQQWKTLTIMQERERLANQIHDTMAQSFAGVGYQIQGIRRSVIRGDHQDSRHIADQLSVAYQLVRRSHEEASRTVAMLSASSPLTHHDLLQALAETARKLAGDQIKTSTRLHGSCPAFTLRLADALLHIGQEAIANAVSHSDPTVMTITLTCEEDIVELVVEDNGKGFEFTPESAGFGILGMQKRACDIAGTLQILSAPGCGTQIRVKARVDTAAFRTRLLAFIKARFVRGPICRASDESRSAPAPGAHSP